MLLSAQAVRHQDTCAVLREHYSQQILAWTWWFVIHDFSWSFIQTTKSIIHSNSTSIESVNLVEMTELSFAHSLPWQNEQEIRWLIWQIHPSDVRQLHIHQLKLHSIISRCLSVSLAAVSRLTISSCLASLPVESRLQREITWLVTWPGNSQCSYSDTGTSLKTPKTVLPSDRILIS
jgi:hypothetical protein